MRSTEQSAPRRDLNKRVGLAGHVLKTFLVKESGFYFPVHDNYWCYLWFTGVGFIDLNLAGDDLTCKYVHVLIWFWLTYPGITPFFNDWKIKTNSSACSITCKCSDGYKNDCCLRSLPRWRQFPEPWQTLTWNPELRRVRFVLWAWSRLCEIVNQRRRLIKGRKYAGHVPISVQPIHNPFHIRQGCYLLILMPSYPLPLHNLLFQFSL